MQSSHPNPVELSLAADSAGLDGWQQAADVLVVGLVDGEALEGNLAAMDAAHGGWIGRALDAKWLKTKCGEIALLASPAANGPRAVMFVGLGDSDLIDRGKAFDLGATIIRRLSDTQRQQITVTIAEQLAPETHDSLVAGIVFGCEGQAIYQAESGCFPPAKVALTATSQQAIDQGKIVGQSVNVTRRLVNEPPNVIYPATFAETAEQVAKEVGLSVEVWDEKRLEAEGCRAMLAVGRASVKPPRLVLLRHSGGGDGEPLIAIVGKGVTFDSGGLSIKPADAMMDMKCDMAGAATVLGVMRAITLLDLPVNVVGICALAENMIAGDSYRVGDVIETRSGTTVEIHNTDAEGRVVLADALDVAVQHKPVAIVDLATLTGACVVALGRDTVGMMTNDSKLVDQIAQAAETEGEWAWELPMFDFFGEQVKSKVADIKNVGDGRWGGAITAGKFLERFVDKTPWVHLDIAGPAFADSPKPHRDAGATGVMVRTLVRWLQGN